MDPLSIAGAGLAVLGSKDILTKVLGPSADYVGGEIKNFVAKCNINLDQVFQNAKSKLGGRLDAPGGVSPRVLKHVFDDGRFADEQIVVDYYGGLLAGSKTPTGKDDRALPYLSKVQQMSAFQLRLHFLFYSELLRIFRATPVNLGSGVTWPQCTLIISHQMFMAALPQEEWLQKEYWKIMSQAAVGLHNEGLVSSYGYGPLEGRREEFEDPPENGILLAPSFLGAELFMWAVGVESPSGHDFFGLDPESIKKPIPILGSASRRKTHESR